MTCSKTTWHSSRVHTIDLSILSLMLYHLTTGLPQTKLLIIMFGVSRVVAPVCQGVVINSRDLSFDSAIIIMSSSCAIVQGVHQLRKLSSLYWLFQY